MYFQNRMRNRHRKNLFCMILFSVTIMIFFYYWGMGGLIIKTITSRSSDKNLCYSRKPYKIRMTIPSFESHNIFFLETSGVNNLSVRQACAVESTARYHPESKIRVLMFTSHLFEDTYHLTQIFNNVYVNVTSFEKVFEDTPLLSWYRNKEWNGSNYEIHHLSDASRLAVIWKYGGMYLDLDIVMLTSLSGFWHQNLRNFLIKEKDNLLSNSIFGFSRRHPFLRKCMLHLLEQYRSDCWLCIGAWLLTNQFNSYCPRLNLGDIETDIHCNVAILPSICAFPIPYHNWKDYFAKNSTEDVISKIGESYLIHLWNFLSSHEVLQPGMDTSYGMIMSVNCPRVYKFATEVGFPF